VSKKFIDFKDLDLFAQNSLKLCDGITFVCIFILYTVLVRIISPLGKDDQKVKQMQKSALFILLIFYLFKNAKIEPFIKVKELKVRVKSHYKLIVFLQNILGTIISPPFIKHFLQLPFSKIPALSLLL